MKFKGTGLIALIFSLFIVSCGGEDCTTDTVAGTYVGTNDCDPDNVMEVSYTITASGDNVTITGDDGTLWTAALDGCSTETYEESIDFFGLMVTTVFDATFTENDLTIIIDVTADGINSVCTTTYTKQ